MGRPSHGANAVARPSLLVVANVRVEGRQAEQIDHVMHRMRRRTGRVLTLLRLQRQPLTYVDHHKQESSCGLGFDCNSPEGQILVCLNTRSLQQAAAQRDEPPFKSLRTTEEQWLASAEWGFGEWGYHRFNLRQRPWRKAWKGVKALVTDGLYMLFMSSRNEAMAALLEPFMQMASRALLRVASGLPDSELGRDPDFRVLCMDHDESPEVGFRRLAIQVRGASQLNLGEGA